MTTTTNKQTTQMATVQTVFLRIPSIIRSAVMVSSSMFAGDALCQQVEGVEKWNVERSAIMGATGLFVSGPIGHTIVHTLERFIPGNSRSASLKKVLCNSLIAPITISIMFTTVTLLKGKTLQDAKTKIENDLPVTYTTAAFYWPFVSYLNFRHTPLQYRPVVGSIAGVIWNIYMAGQTNREHPLAQPLPEVIQETVTSDVIHANNSNDTGISQQKNPEVNT